MKVINTDVLYQDLLSDLAYPQYFPGCSASHYAKWALSETFLKKYQGATDSEACDAVARDKFRTVNTRCGAWQLEESSIGDSILVGEFRKAMFDFFEHRVGRLPLVHSHHSILDMARNGPGASVGSDSTDFYSKLFDSDLSATSSGLYRLYTDYIKDFPLWSDAEETRKRTFGSPDIVAGNRMSFVPKNTTTSRSICVEPVLNMFFQLGLGGLLEKRLWDCFHIDLARQPDINRRLALRASLTSRHSPGERMVTIDLASASDSMSMKMLSEFLPPSFLNWLCMLRSPTSQDGEEEIVLNMVSTMGNGFTFPLQTALFSCVVSAAFSVDSITRINNPREPRLLNQPEPNWGVFGDDIIVPYRLYGKVRRLLEILGFELNTDKTCVYGSFRESCGVDAYDGVDVRGVYLKTLRTPQDVYSIVNQLNVWSFRHGIPLVKTIKRLLRDVPRIAVPLWENADCGVWMPERLLPLLSRNVWKSKLGSYRYKRYVPNRRSLVVSETGIFTPRGLRPRNFNGSGLLLAFYAGYLRDGKIHLKPKMVRYSVRTGVAPNWEFHPTVRSPLGSGGGRPGESLVVFSNLLNAW